MRTRCNIDFVAYEAGDDLIEASRKKRVYRRIFRGDDSFPGSIQNDLEAFFAWQNTESRSVDSIAANFIFFGKLNSCNADVHYLMSTESIGRHDLIEYGVGHPKIFDRGIGFYYEVTILSADKYALKTFTVPENKPLSRKHFLLQSDNIYKIQRD